LETVKDFGDNIIITIANFFSHQIFGIYHLPIKLFYYRVILLTLTNVNTSELLVGGAILQDTTALQEAPFQYYFLMSYLIFL